MYKIIIVGLILLNGCGFAYEKKIKDNYYLIGVDSKDAISIRYRLSNGDYVGRIPESVLEYYTNDTLIIAKTENEKKETLYYIFKTSNDSEYADYTKMGLLQGPFTKPVFDSILSKRNLSLIEFKKV